MLQIRSAELWALCLCPALSAEQGSHWEADLLLHSLSCQDLGEGFNKMTLLGLSDAKGKWQIWGVWSYQDSFWKMLLWLIFPLSVDIQYISGSTRRRCTQGLLFSGLSSAKAHRVCHQSCVSEVCVLPGSHVFWVLWKVYFKKIYLKPLFNSVHTYIRN